MSGRLRAGAQPTSVDEPPGPDLLAYQEHARADASAYDAWLRGGKTRDQLDAEQRQSSTRSRGL